MPQAYNKLAMITVTYNSSKYIERLIKSVEESSIKPLVWVFVDSGSRDGTVRLLNEISAKSSMNIEIISLKENAGYSKGLNIAVESLQKREIPDDLLLLVCNADGYFERGSIERILTCYMKNGRVGMVQPLIMGTNGRIDSAGNLMSLSGITCPNYSVTAKNFFYISGACFLIPLKVYLEVGGADPDIFMGADDLDLSWRVMLRGFELKLCPKAVFFHYGMLERGISPKRMEWRVYSIIWTMTKCLPAHLIVFATSLCFLIHISASFILSVLKEDPLYIYSTVKALFRILKRTKLLIEKRHNVRRGICVNDRKILCRMSPTGLVLRMALRRYIHRGRD
jgi:GT2 family glycosyltransferase